MVGSFVYATYKLDDETLAMPISPLSEILRLRAQSEGQAKHEGLYTKRHADWISWEEAQQARIHAENAYKALPKDAPHSKTTQALREWLAIGLFTLMPPDRVVRLAFCVPSHALPLTLSFCACLAGSHSQTQARVQPQTWRQGWV